MGEKNVYTRIREKYFGGGISPKVIPMPVFFDNYYNDDKEAA